MSRAGEWARVEGRSQIYPISSEPVVEAARLLSSALTTSWTRKQSVKVHRCPEEAEEGRADRFLIHSPRQQEAVAVEE